MIPNSMAGRRFFMVLLAIWLSLHGFAVPARAADSGVGLAWDPSADPGVVGYNVYRSESSDGFSAPLNSIPLTSPSFTDLTALPAHSYFYTVTALSDSGMESDHSNTVNITLALPNQAPSVNAGSDQTITLPASANLSAVAADDGLPGGTLSYRWTVVSGTGVTFAYQAAATQASFAASGTYRLRVTASDGQLTGSDDVTITVKPATNNAPAGTVSTQQTQTVNLAPTTNSTPTSADVPVTVQPASNQAPRVSVAPVPSITLPAAANLVATVTDDGLPSGKLTYQWTTAQGAAVSFTNPRAAATTAAFTEAGSYVLRVTVSDGELSSSADVAVNVDTPVVVDFLRIQPQSLPSLELEFMNYKPNKALVSDAVFQGGAPIKSGRIYAVVQGNLNTGVAFSNPNSQSAVIDFNFADDTGHALYTGQITLAAGAKTSTFLSESPLRPNAGVALDKIRSFTFSASAAIAAAAVRTLTNENGDFLIASLPIADLSKPVGQVDLPFYADGAGWKSEIQLVNTTDSNQKGLLQFFRPQDGWGSTDVIYDIPARSAISVPTPATRPDIDAGWVRVTPDPGTTSPAGWLILTDVIGGVTRTMTTVASTPAFSNYRVFVQTSGANREGPGSTETNLIITNPSSTTATVNVELLSMNWQSTGRRGTVTVPPNRSVNLPLNVVPGMGGIDSAFEGILQFTGSPVSVVGMTLRYNDLQELVVTSVPAINSSLRSDPWFLFTVNGGGVETQMKDVHSLGPILQMTSTAQQTTSASTTTTTTTTTGSTTNAPKPKKVSGKLSLRR